MQVDTLGVPVEDPLLALIREVAAEVVRYHITRSAPGYPLASSWWRGEAAARARFAALVTEIGSLPGARITLADEETGETLDEWPGDR
ncbi:hypothetical protein ACIRU8_39790 [Streptomyces sp. NPDC101175]|uniref:hypothetical protein n=1 Tax=Streptomyces sp. NPDC101175 TaxID=3366123 RepID=UPI0038398ABC